MAQDLLSYPADRKIESGVGRDGHPSLRPEHPRVVAHLLHIFARRGRAPGDVHQGCWETVAGQGIVADSRNF